MTGEQWKGDLTFFRLNKKNTSMLIIKYTAVQNFLDIITHLSRRITAHWYIPLKTKFSWICDEIMASSSAWFSVMALSWLLLPSAN